MTVSTASEQIDLERNGERRKEKMKERERQVVSGTIQLPSELYWISPPFKIKRQISLSPPLDPTGRITLFFQTAPEPVPFTCPLFQRVYINLSTVEFYYLSYAFLNIEENSKTVYYFFFYCIFLHVKKKICVVCICNIICIMLLFCVLYYPSIIMIMVKKNVNVITVKDDCFFFPLLKVNGF